MPITDYAPASWRPSPNYWQGRDGQRLTGIVLHATAGYEPGPVEWFQSAASQVSAHYIVNRDGTVIQTVREADSAWHAGEVTSNSRFYRGVNPNRTTIGIEHERDASNTSPLTPAQLAASLALVRSIVRRHGPLEIIAHDEIDVGRVCPGPGFPLQVFRDAVGVPKETSPVKNFPALYAQRDPRWANQRLGTADGITLGQYGCYVTSMAMLACYYGHTITPAALDDLYTARGIYVDGDMMPDDALARAFPNLELVAVHDYANAPADLGLLRSIAADPSLTAVIGLDFDHNPADGVQTHFLDLAGCDASTDGSGLRVADPWYGGVAPFDRNYGSDPATTIQKVVVYKGPAPAATVTPLAPTVPPAAVGPLRFRVRYDGALHAQPDETSPVTCHIKAGWELIAVSGDSAPWVSCRTLDGKWGWDRRDNLERIA
jgi:N-acetyl-anhydromuramyl-L-alanine amidase AmpD